MTASDSLPLRFSNPFSFPPDFLAYLLEPRKGILITAHRDPDFDAIGSCLALGHLLRNRHIPFTIWLPDTISEQHHFLPGFSEIQKNIPAEIDAYDTIFFLDCSNLNRVQNLELLKPYLSSHTVLNLDHHADNTGFGTLNAAFFASSVGEQLTQLFAQMHWDFTPEMATCLYAAICYDTGRFLYPSVTADTLRIAGFLKEQGADIARVHRAQFESWTQNHFNVLEVALSRLVVNYELGLAYTSLPAGIPKSDLKLVEFIRQLADIEVVMVLQEQEVGPVKVSLRSKNVFNVQQFASRFGGGGHVRASGITIEGTLSKVEQLLVGALEQALRSTPVA